MTITCVTFVSHKTDGTLALELGQIFGLVLALGPVLARLTVAARLKFAVVARVLALAYARGQVGILGVELAGAIVLARVRIAAVLKLVAEQKAVRDAHAPRRHTQQAHIEEKHFTLYF